MSKNILYALIIAVIIVTGVVMFMQRSEEVSDVNNGTERNGETTEYASTPITGSPAEGVSSTFDIRYVEVERDDTHLTFLLETADALGVEMPDPAGDLASAPVYAYVWPTSLRPLAVGFDTEGILALTVTSHPDFDDTPLYDEDGDGDPSNDGRLWHAHWVVLAENSACEAGLAVKDVPEGEDPNMPDTWPELPIFIDSPEYHPTVEGSTLRVRVPMADLDLEGITEMAHDGVTSGLQVNEDLEAPLLCVTQVFDVASGDLSLPGKAEL